jgi:hypothetical protein
MAKKNILITLIAGLLTITTSCQKDEHPARIPITNTPADVLVGIYDSVIYNQVKYILSNQLPSGAFKDNAATNSRICPYFTSIACLALLKKPTSVNVAAVKKYLIWYMSKLNGTINPKTGGIEVAGSVYDYYAPGETTDGTYDSVDSYAALFLLLMKEFAGLSPANQDWAKGYTTQLNLIGSALERCVDNVSNNVPTAFSPDDNDGLSVDSYVHGAKYTMDNSEVNAGLKAMVWLQINVLGGSQATHFRSLLDGNTNAIESQLWRETMYNWNDNGSAGSTFSKWAIFYPDATCQLFPGLFSVIDPLSPRANLLYSSFNFYYPAWSSGTVYSGGYPWAIVCYAAAMVNDKVRVDQYINHILSINRGGTQKDLWYNAEAAYVIMAADKMKNQGNTPVFVPTPVVPQSPVNITDNIALNKTATASTSFNDPKLSIDGNLSTRWSLAAATEGEWYKVDLGSVGNVGRVDIKWEGAYASDYVLQVSTDNINFTTVFSTNSGTGGNKSHAFTVAQARYVKILLNKGALPYPMSFWEFEVYQL